MWTSELFKPAGLQLVTLPLNTLRKFPTVLWLRWSRWKLPRRHWIPRVCLLELHWLAPLNTARLLNGGSRRLVAITNMTVLMCFHVEFPCSTINVITPILGTPTHRTLTWHPTAQDEKEKDTWWALPYEMAHAIVRTLCSHMHQWRLAKAELARLKDKDPKKSNAKTKKAQKAFDDLHDMDRYAVMNRRTRVAYHPCLVS